MGRKRSAKTGKDRTGDWAWHQSAGTGASGPGRRRKGPPPIAVKLKRSAFASATKDPKGPVLTKLAPALQARLAALAEAEAARIAAAASTEKSWSSLGPSFAQSLAPSLASLSRPEVGARVASAMLVLLLVFALSSVRHPQAHRSISISGSDQTLTPAQVRSLASADVEGPRSRPSEPWSEPDALASSDLAAAASSISRVFADARRPPPQSTPHPLPEPPLNVARAEDPFDVLGREPMLPAEPAPVAIERVPQPPAINLCSAPAGLLAAPKRLVEGAPVQLGTAATDDPLKFGAELAAAAEAETHHMVVYDAKYMTIAYPQGDVPAQFGVCTDVVIRAYRALGIDLQAWVHEARAGGPTDRNIDHRRTELLRGFFAKYGESLPLSPYSEDYLPGDIVTYYRPQNHSSTAHIALVSNKIGPSGRPMIVHNRGWGVQLEDALFVDQMTGHYRFRGTSPTAVALLKREGTMVAQARLPASVVRPSAGVAAVDARAKQTGGSMRGRRLALARINGVRGALSAPMSLGAGAPDANRETRRN